MFVDTGLTGYYGAVRTFVDVQGGGLVDLTTCTLNFNFDTWAADPLRRHAVFRLTYHPTPEYMDDGVAGELHRATFLRYMDGPEFAALAEQTALASVLRDGAGD